MEHQKRTLEYNVATRYKDDYYYDLLEQDFSDLILLTAKEFNPGRIVDLLGQIYVFKLKKEKAKISRQVLDESNKKISFKVNGTSLVGRNGIVKRTLTATDQPYSLWEFILDSEDNTCTVLHHYAAKQTRQKDAECQGASETPTFKYNDYEQRDGIREEGHYGTENDMVLPDIDMGDLDNELDKWINGDEPPSTNLHYNPAHLYYKLLIDSASEKRFFNRSIQIHEDLFKFKALEQVERDDSDSEETVQVTKVQLDFNELTENDFEFITHHTFVHLVSPAGTGKTMAMLQLAKSFHVDGRGCVPVLCKAEYFWSKASTRSTLESIVESSMITADIRDTSKQQEWRENLERLIRDSNGVILLLDAVDEMKSQERAELLRYIEVMMQCVPGVASDVNIVAMVVSSRPGVTLPQSDELGVWTTLKLTKIKQADRALRSLCTDDFTFERAQKQLQSFAFPKTLFWYSLLAIDAQTVDHSKTIANSQYEFLEGLLLQSIKVTQQKKDSLDQNQHELLSEHPIVLLQVAALIAYLAKRLGTTRIIELEQHLSYLISESNLPLTFILSSNSIIRKLLPFYQFFHCCYACNERSTFKYIRFDHQIIWDYLAAEFIVKIVVQNNYPMLLVSLSRSEDVKFDWKRCVESMTLPNSEWTQTLHLVADALPPTQLTMAMKECDEDSAISWITSVFQHPRCRDVSDPSSDYVKLFVSSLFNASRKTGRVDIPPQKRLKGGLIQQASDDHMTVVGFNLVLKLFGQPIIGQVVFDDICRYNPLSSLISELTLRNRAEEFTELLIRKFDGNQNQTPAELLSLVKHLRDSNVQSLVMERLFDRLSSKSDQEGPGHPVRDVIHEIFVKIFKEELCADFLIERLKSTDIKVQATAKEVLLCFNSLSLTRVKQIVDMIKPGIEHQRIIEALPEEIHVVLFDELKAMALSWETPSNMYQVFNRIPLRTPESVDKFVSLLDDYRTYLIAEMKLSEHNREVIFSEDNLAKLALIYKDPVSFYQRPFTNDEVFNMQTCIWHIVMHQDLSEEYKQVFQRPQQLPPRTFVVDGVQYEAAGPNDYIASFCSGAITQEKLILLSRYYLRVYVKTVDVALQLMDHVAEQFQRLSSSLTPELLRDNQTLHSNLNSRRDINLMTADYILGAIWTRIIKSNPINNAQLSRLLQYLYLAADLRTFVKEEWQTFINMKYWEQMLMTFLSQLTISPDNMVLLWQVVGTVHFQYFYNKMEDRLLPDGIPVILQKWTKEDCEAFLTQVSQLEFTAKLQYDIENLIIRLKKDKQ